MKQILPIIFFVVYFPLAYCCSCIGEATVSEELERSDVVFTGRVISERIIEVETPVEMLKVEPEMYVMEYKLQVSTVFKGEIKQDTVVIITGIGNGDCGFNFKIGNEYIVYSFFKNEYYPGNTVSEFLYTNICSRTRLATDKKEIKALRKKCKKRKGAH